MHQVSGQEIVKQHKHCLNQALGFFLQLLVEIPFTNKSEANNGQEKN